MHTLQHIMCYWIVKMENKKKIAMRSDEGIYQLAGWKIAIIYLLISFPFFPRNGIAFAIYLAHFTPPPSFIHFLFLWLIFWTAKKFKQMRWKILKLLQGKMFISFLSCKFIYGKVDMTHQQCFFKDLRVGVA